MRRYILFHGMKHPEQMVEAEIRAFLALLAVERKVAASTQNQAHLLDAGYDIRTVQELLGILMFGPR